MANNRKVQAEIDRLLKKCVEGFEIYDEMYHKAETTPATAKMADQLRREVKKLQRFRDEIKAHVASPEVKDTRGLEDMQKEIESRMQRFKTIEREMKTKTFSKEGLANAGESETPLAQAESFLKGVIAQGRARVEILEYEASQSARSRSRKTKSGSEKTEAQVKFEKMQQHLYSWETLLRMLDNEEVDPSEIEDDLKNHIQEVLEEDVDAETLADMSYYEPFDIPDKPIVKPVPKPEPEAETEAKASPKTAAKKTPAEPPAAASVKHTPASPAVKATPASATATTPSAPSAKAPIPAQAAAAAPTTAATASVPAVAARAAMVADAPEEDEQLAEWADDDLANDDTFGDEVMPAKGGDLASMAQATSTLARDWEQEKLKFMQQEKQVAATTAAASSASSPAAAAAAAAASAPVNEWERRRLQQQAAAAAQTGVTTATAAVPTPDPAAPTAASVVASSAAATAPTAAKAAPTHATGTSHTHESRHAAPLDAAAMHRMLDMSLANLPHTLDVEKQRPFEPPNAIEPIPYFPQDVHPVFASRDIYTKFDEETLFFIFYYNQKTYHQYFAAKELKHRSYRFHTEQKRWYLRRDKPKEATTERERGAYMYFDYEDSWSKKETDDFTFEYKYLEDDL